MAKKPKGFERAGVEKAKESISELLKNLKEVLAKKGIEPKIYLHRNRDDSIDGELTFNAKRGTTSKAFLRLLERAMPKSSRREIWSSIGVRFEYEDPEDKYTRYKGLSQVQTNYRRFQPAKMAIISLTSSIIAQRVEKKVRRKISSFFIRFNWNPDNAQPKRR